MVNIWRGRFLPRKTLEWFAIRWVAARVGCVALGCLVMHVDPGTCRLLGCARTQW